MKRNISIFFMLLFYFFIKQAASQSCVGSNTLKVTIQACEGIDAQGKTIFNIHPNPASDKIKVEWLSNETYNVCLTDLSGRVLYSSNEAQHSIEINIEQLSCGIYFIQLYNEHSHTAIKKFDIIK